MQDMFDEELDDLFRQAALDGDSFKSYPTELTDHGWRSVKQRIDSDPGTVGLMVMRLLIMAVLTLVVILILERDTRDFVAERNVVPCDVLPQTALPVERFAHASKTKADGSSQEAARKTIDSSWRPASSSNITQTQHTLAPVKLKSDSIQTTHSVAVAYLDDALTTKHKLAKNKRGVFPNKKVVNQGRNKEEPPYIEPQNMNTDNGLYNISGLPSDVQTFCVKRDDDRSADSVPELPTPVKDIRITQSAPMRSLGQAVEGQKDDARLNDTLSVYTVDSDAVRDSTSIIRSVKTSRFSLNVFVSPDVSFTKARQFHSVGSDIGMMVEYAWSQRLRISTGVMYSKKRYRARGADYHLPESAPGAGDIALDNIKATCQVFDIPLTIRYNFLIRKQYIVSATAGLSSYVLNTEHYNYDVSYKGGDWYADSFSQAKGGLYLFSVANLSVGYEKRLNRHFSLRAEPFVKLPMLGIGYGKVKVASSGVFIVLKYTFR